MGSTQEATGTYDLRSEALNQAIRSALPTETPESTVRRAEVYARYLQTGRSDVTASGVPERESLSGTVAPEPL